MKSAFATIVIPAYNPETTLLDLIEQLQTLNAKQPIIVVNDGSTETIAQSIFQRLANKGVEVVHHAINLGKGEALKSGFNQFLLGDAESSPGIVTADADCQHSAADILTLCHALEDNAERLYLGVRSFQDQSIPWRSRFGNRLTRSVFHWVSHLDLQDTQTGLRALPTAFVKQCIGSQHRGYEFELDMLLLASKQAIEIKQIAITTIYNNHNKSSHFNPILDSLKIYFVFIRFASISLFSAVIDFILFTLSYLLSTKVLLALIIGRVCSGMVNYTMNKRLAFKDSHKTMPSAVKYLVLACSLSMLAYLLIVTLASLGLNIFMSKVIAEVVLFIASFSIQRLFVFRE